MKFAARSVVAAAMIAGLVSQVGVAHAELDPRSGPRDARIRFVTYNKDEVVSIQGSYGASTMISFSEDEKIETLSAGDATAWRIEANKRGNVLFIKPIEKDASANLNVLTNKRSYILVLKADFRPIDKQVFSVIFRYLEDGDGAVEDASILAEARARVAQPARAQLKAENTNSDYGYKGSSINKPLVVFDDGVKTWFRFQSSNEIPAIYVVDAERNERLVDFRREGEYIVVDKVNYQWTLRNGKESTCIFNQRLNNLNEPTGFEAHAPVPVGSHPARKAVSKARTRHAIS